MLTDWNPDPAPFGNARGLDSVALDVAARIAHRFGADVRVGKMPDDITERGARLYAGEPVADPPRPAKLITVGRGGVTAYTAPGSTTSGYESHDWRANLTPETIVIDSRGISDEAIFAYAVRGPMIDPWLPEGKISQLGDDVVSDPIAATIANAYLREHGGLAAQGYDDAAALA